MITRRGLLAGILAAGVAPVFVRAASLMRLWVPKPLAGVIGLLDAQGNEISGNGYARAPYVPGQDIVFPVPTANWGTVTHILLPGGVAIPLHQSKYILAGDSLSAQLPPSTPLE